MLFYVGILITSSIFAFLYSREDKINKSFLFLILCFLSLFIPSIFRYGIGADYFSYASLYTRIGNGESVSLEPMFVLACKILNILGLTYHSLFVLFSFLTILFVFLSIPKKYFYIGIPIFVFILYIDSYCVIRNALAAAIMCFAFKKYFMKQYKQCCIFSLLAFLNHYSMILPILVLVCAQILPYISNKIYIMVYFAIFLLLELFGTQVIDFIMDNIVSKTPYYYYATGYYASKSAGGTGLGTLLKQFTLFCIMLLIQKEDIPKKDYKVFMLSILVLLVSFSFHKILYIFGRIQTVFSFIFIFLFIYCINSTFKYKKVILIFVFTAFTIIFLNDLRINNIKEVGHSAGREIVPFKTLNNYQDEENLKSKKLYFEVPDLEIY